MSDSIVVHDNKDEPVVFTQDELGWLLSHGVTSLAEALPEPIDPGGGPG